MDWTGRNPTTYTEHLLLRITLALEAIAFPPQIELLEEETLPDDFPARDALMSRGMTRLEDVPKTVGGLQLLKLTDREINQIVTRVVKEKA